MTSIYIGRDMLLQPIWFEGATVRITWITMRFLADKQGMVRAPNMAIAHQAGISEAECHAAITRMIEMGEASTIDGGWLMTDHAKIQEAGAKHLRSEQNRRAQKKWRDKKRDGR